MKTSIQSLLATGLMALVLSTSTVYAYEAPTTKAVSAKTADLAAIQKIYVKGNVSVTLVQAPKSKTYFSRENSEDVTVKKVGNSLYIDSKNNINAAKITVYVDQIYRIDASENAFVDTKDVLNLKNLQIFLKDNAIAEIDSKTESLYTIVKDGAELKLKGHAAFYTMSMDKYAKVTLDKFSSTKTDVKNAG